MDLHGEVHGAVAMEVHGGLWSMEVYGTLTFTSFEDSTFRTSTSTPKWSKGFDGVLSFFCSIPYS